MLKATCNKITLYVDRGSRQWVVRDADGNLWQLPSTQNPWGDRQPFTAYPEMTLEQVPGHYKAQLGLRR